MGHLQCPKAGHLVVGIQKGKETHETLHPQRGFGCSNWIDRIFWIFGSIELGPRDVGNGFRKKPFGVPVVAQWLMNLASIHENEGSIPGLAQWFKDLVLP